jgi:hypothetical protein
MKYMLVSTTVHVTSVPEYRVPSMLFSLCKKSARRMIDVIVPLGSSATATVAAREGGTTYMLPKAKVSHAPALTCHPIASFQIDGSGRRSMATSVAVFGMLAKV